MPAVRRNEDPRLLRGMGAYVDDIDSSFFSLLLRILVLTVIVGAVVTAGIMWAMRSIQKSLGGEPDYATQLCRRIADGDLTVAFDCTFVALALSLVVMYFLHTIQRDEESLVLDCQQYCQEHLVLRLYDPQPEHASDLVSSH